MAKENRNDPRGDAADDAQEPRRRGLEGKGFDAGTGYGGAGSDSAYSRESGSGGQSSTAGSGAVIPRGTDEHSDVDEEARTAAPPPARDEEVAPRQVDPEGQLGAGRHDPTR